MVRINGLHTPWIDDDLAAIMPHAPHALLLPKAEGCIDLDHISAKLAVHEAQNNLENGSTALLALATETAKGVLQMGTYGELPSSLERRLIGLTWGYEDLSLALGAPDVCEGEEHMCFEPYRLARTLLLLAASAAKVLPVDGISRNFKDLEAFKKACEQAYHLGFLAKLAIHPAQIPIINAMFSPSPELVSHAQEVVHAFEAQPDSGVIAINGRMFDRPHYHKAKNILARATLQYAPCSLNLIHIKG
jgi:citrate lyase subunit beta/citryl-CoA lyase